MLRLLLFLLIFAAVFSGCGGDNFNAATYPVIFPDCDCGRLEGAEAPGVEYSFEGKNSAFQNGGYAFFLSTKLINKTSSRVRYVRNKALIESKNFNYYYGQEETYLIAPRDTSDFILSAACILKTNSLQDTIVYAVPDTEAVSITLYLYTEPKGKVITIKTSANMKLR